LTPSPAPTLRPLLLAQYRAGLDMLREAVELCPGELWEDGSQTNAFWQVAYHALFFTRYYLQPTSENFRPWDGHQEDAQHPDGIAGPADPASPLPLLPRPYTKAEVLDFWRVCQAALEADLAALDLESAESGFPWYPISKLEHQLVNLRHLQHHAGQLADRVRAATGRGVRWVGSAPQRPADDLPEPARR
jgi:hypothetical protein